jgi:hypothetical protein
MKVIPDKFIMLHIKNDVTIDTVKRKLKSEDSQIQYKQEEVDQIARSALTEYKV